MSYRLRLKDLREDSDMNQSELAKKINCSQRSISSWETGFRDIPTETIIELAKIFNVSMDYMYGLTDEKRPFPKS